MFSRLLLSISRLLIKWARHIYSVSAYNADQRMDYVSKGEAICAAEQCDQLLDIFHIQSKERVS